MRISAECYQCYVRQGVLLAQNATGDPELQKDLVKEMLRIAAEAPADALPSHLQIQAEGMVRQRTGDRDFYQREKEDSIALIHKAMPFIEEYLEEHQHSTEAYLRVAIVGNHMDIGVYGKNIVFTRELVQALLEKPYGHSDLEELLEQIKRAKNLLLVADNVGEHLLDKLLLQHLGQQMQVTYAVRGGWILNDITMEYALRDGLDQVARLITTGSNHAGVVPAEASAEFMKEFLKADLVICKGMGNFETSHLYPRDVFSIFKAKCAHVARLAEVAQDDLVIKHVLGQPQQQG